MKLTAHGIEIDLPPGWEGRIYRRPGAQPTLHAANFALPAEDGDFGSGATAAMPHAGVLLVVKEYQPGPNLTAGRGLFESEKLPLPLDPRGFNPHCLQVGRPQQAGLQHFFTTSGRPFCLYAVVNGLGGQPRVARQARDQFGQMNEILGSLRFEPAR